MNNTVRPTREIALAALLRHEQAAARWARLVYSGAATVEELRAAFQEAGSAYRGLYHVVLALTENDS